ncbi:MAG: caspase family protein [Alphaproteobacteria bacterium]|nr:caspase family protein [Alphaproteobacteria bacterium]
MLLPLLIPSLLAGPALADPVPLGPPAGVAGQAPAVWAVVVGSNRPGPGQAALRYAGSDAERVADVFTQLGDVDPGSVLLLRDPAPADVLDALDTVAAELQASAAAHTQVLFYYSGHARSGGLDLGDETLALSDLRGRLEALPADVRLVVLDACQSGAMSDAKGLSPAAAFSSASVQGLDAEGMAVIASSSSDELSQESDELQGSYFTHHWVTGLRGAADADADGLVTLDEAYGYAYDRTVVSTASTAIGRQHPTLETDLRGRGALALTRPGRATARLHFGPDDAGQILLVHDGSGLVAAEVDKAPGDALTLALAPGDYEVLWRKEDETARCRQTLAEGRSQLFAPVACQQVVEEETVAKGGPTGPTPYETFFVELGVGGMGAHHDAFTDTLEDFGYSENLNLHLAGMVQLVYTPHRNLSVVGAVANLESQGWSRDVHDTSGVEHTTKFRWGGGRYGVYARAQAPVLDGWIVPYLQVGGGLANVRTVFDDGERGTTIERHLGWHLAGGGGLQLVPSFGRNHWRHIGLYGQGEIVTARALDNLLGDTHDTGATTITVGIRFGD